MYGRKLILVSLAVTGLIASDNYASAQSKNDRAKKTYAKLFVDSLSSVSDSTVRVRVDGKDTILGTVIEKGGYILTKGSEITKEPISVRLRDGTEYDATYVGYQRESDLALLKIDADPPPVKFVDIKDIVVGNWVSTSGMDSDPVAVGIVSVGPRKLYSEESFVENKKKGYLGIQFGPGTRPIIDIVTPDGAAAKAKLKSGDLILKIGGKAVDTREKMLEIMDLFKPGDVITVVVKRKVKDEEEETTVEKEMSFEVKLQDRPKSDTDRGDLQNSMGGQLSGRKTGFPKVITHDTILKPNECGSPLVDLDGKVLGINIARAGRVESWALPGDVVMATFKDLKDGKFPPPKNITVTKPAK